MSLEVEHADTRIVSAPSRWGRHITMRFPAPAACGGLRSNRPSSPGAVFGARASSSA